MDIELEHSAPAKGDIISARDQLVAMRKTWINTNKDSVGICANFVAVAKLVVPKNQRRWRTARAIREGSLSTAYNLIATKLLGLSGIGVTLVSPIGIWNKCLLIICADLLPFTTDLVHLLQFISDLIQHLILNLLPFMHNTLQFSTLLTQIEYNSIQSWVLF